MYLLTVFMPAPPFFEKLFAYPRPLTALRLHACSHWDPDVCKLAFRKLAAVLGAEPSANAPWLLLGAFREADMHKGAPVTTLAFPAVLVLLAFRHKLFARSSTLRVALDLVPEATTFSKWAPSVITKIETHLR